MAFKVVFHIFILIVFANPVYSTTKYDQKVAWITGLLFGLFLILIIFNRYKSKLGDENGKGLQYS